MSLRQALFWLHLAAGLLAGLVIAILSLTGCALALRPQILGYAARSAARVDAPAGAAARRSIDDLLRQARAAEPELRVSSVVLSADPRSAVAVGFGRDAVRYLNPYTGEARPVHDAAWRAFFQKMEAVHRWLAVPDTARATGRMVTGAANFVFFFLAVSGWYLWWPRKGTWAALRAAARPRWRLQGRAREWNWHTAGGFWAAPVLIVLTATGTVMSYRWANDLLYRAAGTNPSVEADNRAPAVPPAAGARPLPYAALFARAEAELPNWSEITLRLGGLRGGGGNGGGAGGRSPAPGTGARLRGDRGAPVVLSVREKDAWPSFAGVQLTLDPFRGDVLQRSGWAETSRGRRWRRWVRFLHTGEAFGWIGQSVAGLASLFGVVLVATGFLLAGRRLVRSLRAR